MHSVFVTLLSFNCKWAVFGWCELRSTNRYKIDFCCFDRMQFDAIHCILFFWHSLFFRMRVCFPLAIYTECSTWRTSIDQLIATCISMMIVFFHVVPFSVALAFPCRSRSHWAHRRSHFNWACCCLSIVCWCGHSLFVHVGPHFQLYSNNKCFCYPGGLSFNCTALWYTNMHKFCLYFYRNVDFLPAGAHSHLFLTH